MTVAIKRLLRSQAEAAVEHLLAILDDLDGDPDLELEPDLEITCEDEGAQCEDEGFNSDDEPNADDTDCSWAVCAFAMDQTGAQWFGGNRPATPG